MLRRDLFQLRDLRGKRLAPLSRVGSFHLVFAQRQHVVAGENIKRAAAGLPLTTDGRALAKSPQHDRAAELLAGRGLLELLKQPQRLELCVAQPLVVGARHQFRLGLNNFGFDGRRFDGRPFGLSCARVACWPSLDRLVAVGFLRHRRPLEIYKKSRVNCPRVEIPPGPDQPSCRTEHGAHCIEVCETVKRRTPVFRRSVSDFPPADVLSPS